MKRLGIVLCLASIFSACILVAACGKKDQTEDEVQSASNQTKSAVPASEESRAKTDAGGGELTGISQKKLAASNTAVAKISNPVATNVSDETLMETYLTGASSTEPGSAITPGREHHLAFEAESRDAEWSDFVEPRLKFYLAGQQGSSNFAVTSLQCRSTMCEVLAVNKSSQGTEADTGRWQDIIFSMKRERWFSEAQIQEPMMEFGIVDNGRIAILTYLIRK